MPEKDNIQLGYKELLIHVKQHIRSAQAKAALAVNSGLIQLYWNLGKMIADNQLLFEGRNNYVDQLAKDLRAEFPEMTGFSKRNIFYCRKFYLFYTGSSVQQPVALNESVAESDSVQQVVALNTDSVQQPVRLNASLLSVPWGHHVVLINKIKNPEEALFYLQQTIVKNLCREILDKSLSLHRIITCKSLKYSNLK